MICKEKKASVFTNKKLKLNHLSFTLSLPRYPHSYRVFQDIFGIIAPNFASNRFSLLNVGFPMVSWGIEVNYFT